MSNSNFVNKKDVEENLKKFKESLNPSSSVNFEQWQSHDKKIIVGEALGENNKNFILQKENNKLCVTLGTEDPIVNNALTKLKGASFLPKTHYRKTLKGDDKLEYFAQVVEVADSSVKALGENNKNTREENFNTITKNLKKVCEECSQIISKLDEKNVIYSDFKVGNLLMRKDGSIFISDPKGFLRMEDQRSIQKTIYKNNIATKERRLILNYADITKDTLSQEGMRKMDIIIGEDNAGLSNDEEGKKEGKALWLKENAHQLGLVLYYVVTGLTPLDRDKMGKISLTYDHPYFNTPAGEKVKEVINKLIEPSLEKRYTHKQANRDISQIKSAPNLNQTMTSSLHKSQLTTISMFNNKGEKNPPSSNKKEIISFLKSILPFSSFLTPIIYIIASIEIYRLQKQGISPTKNGRK